MTASDRLFLHSLVAIAWVYGAGPVEPEYVDGLLDAFGADDPEAAALHTWAAIPRAIQDIPADRLSLSERHTLLIHAAMLDGADRQVLDSGNLMILGLASHLSISPAEADDIISRATGRISYLGVPKAPSA